MEDEEQDEKETNPDVDHSKNPLLAWKTRREEWATTPELKNFAVGEGFRTMQDMGRELMLTGDLNFREYDRVLSLEQ